MTKRFHREWLRGAWALAAVVASGLTTGCSDDHDSGGSDAGSTPSAPDAAGAEPCAWGVDALLREVGAEAPARESCGSYGSASHTEALVGGLTCFLRSAEAGDTVEVTFNPCLDCAIPTTFVATHAGLFAVLMEQDHFGDDQREARVESCTELALAEDGWPVCAGAIELYQCLEPLQPIREPPAPLPVAPFKLGDVPAGSDPTVPLHLYVSNQSFAEPLVRIDVFIDDFHVVTGDFDVGSQHTWILFELAVPSGSRTVRAWASQGDVELEQTIDLAGERWAAIDYWNYPEEAEGKHFTLHVQATPLAFD